jgi:hypothetical protein
MPLKDGWAKNVALQRNCTIIDKSEKQYELDLKLEH